MTVLELAIALLESIKAGEDPAYPVRFVDGDGEQRDIVNVIQGSDGQRPAVLLFETEFKQPYPLVGRG